jgi:ribonuclease HI
MWEPTAGRRSSTTRRRGPLPGAVTGDGARTPLTRLVGVPMTAKYATTCKVCSSRISPGEEIGRSGAAWAHAACAAPEAAGAAPGTTAARPKRTTQRPEMPAAEGALEVWTDGACSGNPGPGGWAWATRDGRQGSGGETPTTNQRMEIRAALEAVRALSGPLVVVSDSTYVVNCFRDGWWRGWLGRGWVTSARKPVVSRDLWEPLVTLFNERGDVSFRWVKGHSGDQMNDLVDALAVEQTRADA